MTRCTSPFLRFIRVALALVGLGILRAGADTVLKTVTTGSEPYTIALNPVTNKIYVTVSGNHGVLVIDGASNTSTDVNLAGAPEALAVNTVTNKIYVVSSDVSTVTVIDGATNGITTISLPTSSDPTAVAVNPVTNQIYVTVYESDQVAVIDGATNTVTSNISVGTHPDALAVNPVTNQIYVANPGSNNVTVINGATGATSTVSTGAGSTPFAVAVNPVTNQIYVASSGSNNVTVINGATGAASTVSTGANSAPGAVTVNPATNQIYVANVSSNNVTVIDGATNSTSSVTVGTSPYNIAVNPATNKIYVPNSGSGNVTVINGATNTTSTLTAGTNPFGVAVNPVTDRIYVTNYDSASVSVINGDTNATSTMAVGANPNAVAVNPVTDQIYAANYSGNTVSIIDAASNAASSTVNAGANPFAVAVNPVTNQVYVTNNGGSNVTVIDGATQTTASVPAGTNPGAVALNPVTNQIYVANYSSNNVTIIDGATNATTTVNAGTSPTSVAVDPATNQIFVVNEGSDNVTVIDGVTNDVFNVDVGTTPMSVAVNPATNQVYVANYGSGNVSVIDERTDAVSATITAGTAPVSVAVNPVTNTIYVANYDGGNVTVINGNTNAASSVNAGTHPTAVAVNAATNQIYVANYGAGVTVIDGATNSASLVGAGTSPTAVAVNPVTNQVYVADYGSDSVTVIDPAPAGPAALFTAITPQAGNVTYSATPTFCFQATSLYGPIAPPVREIFYQVDSTTGPWQFLPPTDGAASVTLSAVNLGPHTLFAFATDGQDATSTMTAGNSIIGQISAYSFVYGDMTPMAAPQSISLAKGTSTAVTLTGSGSNPLVYMIATPPAHGTLSGTPPNLTYTTTNASYIGPDSFTFIVYDYVQDSTPATVSIEITDDVPVANGQSLGTTRGAPVPITLSGNALDPLTYSIVTPPIDGMLSGTPPHLTYTPNGGFVGNDSFAFEVNDGYQNSAPATVVIAVVETPPAATAQAVTVTKGASTAVTLTGFGLSALTFSVATQPAHGTLSGTAPNLIYTTSNASYLGVDAFTFTVNDGLEGSAPATVTIQIIDDIPLANAQALETTRAVPLAVTLTGSALDPLTYAVVKPPAHGVLTGTAPQLTYSPSSSFVGNDSFTFQVNDGIQSSAPAAVSISVVEAVAPVATAQNVTVERGAGIPITLSAIGNPPFTYTVLTQPAQGALSGAAPALTYTAGKVYTGADSFTFKVNDGFEDSAPATIDVTIVDSPPMAVNDVFYTASNSLAPLPLDVLANDSDPEGRPLSIIAVSRASAGKATIAANQQSITYIPDLTFATSGRPDTFTYTITNGDKTATAEVTVMNPFYHHQENFDGLVTNGTGNAGYLALALKGTGAYSGLLELNGTVNRFLGVFASGGGGSVTIKRKAPLPALTLRLQFNDATGGAISAAFSDGSAFYAGTLEPQTEISSQNPVAQAGSYTVMISAPAPLIGTAATSTATVTDGTISGLTLTTGGSGYITAPLVTITGGGGSGATATATVANGEVTVLTLVDHGVKYASSGVSVAINPPADSLPGGTGWGTVTLTSSGVVSLSGKLGDATPFSCSSYLKADGTFPIYVPLNTTGAPGSIWGSAAFQDIPNVSDFTATLYWNKATQRTGSLYRAGFSAQVSLVGSYYALAKGFSALAFSNSTSGAATVNLSAGNLATALQDTISVSATNAVKELGLGADHLELTIAGRKGLITGSFLSSAKSASTVTGVLLQKPNLGAGLFTGATLTGSFNLNPQ